MTTEVSCLEEIEETVLLQNLPFYRIFAADARFPRDGRHLEVVGHYNPIPGIYIGLLAHMYLTVNTVSHQRADLDLVIAQY